MHIDAALPSLLAHAPAAPQTTPPCVVIRALPYAPYSSTERWNASHAAMQQAVLALPTAGVRAAAYGGLAVACTSALVAAATASVAVGVGTVLLAPVLVPVGLVMLGGASITSGVGAVAVAVVVAAGAGKAAACSVRALIYASGALGEELAHGLG